MSAASLLSKETSLFNIDSSNLSMFCKICIQTVLTFSLICWFGNVSQKDKNNLQRISSIETGLNNPLSLSSVKSRYCVKPLKPLVTIHIFYTMSTSFCSRPSHPKPNGIVGNSYQCCTTFQRQAPLTFPQETRQSLCVYVVLCLFNFYL